MYAQIYHTKSTSTDLVYCSANNSWYVPPPTDTTSIQVFLSINQGGVQVEVRDASVTLTGPGGSLPVTYNSPGWEPNGGQNGFYMNKDDAYSCQTGTYVLTATTPLHSMSATFIGPGNTTIAPDGSSASWVVEGNHDYIWVGSATTFKNTYLTPVSIDANSPVVIPASAYSDGPDNYSVAVKLEYRTNQITGGSGEISFYDETDLNFTK
jgi:archaellin